MHEGALEAGALHPLARYAKKPQQLADAALDILRGQRALDEIGQCVWGWVWVCACVREPACGDKVEEGATGGRNEQTCGESIA